MELVPPQDAWVEPGLGKQDMMANEAINRKRMVKIQLQYLEL
tara:strand:- start:9121 stop:9246 length:126 start_codon:yes stop_codon:yes gene_type:complete